MAYTIYKYDGTVLATIADGTVNSDSTSLTLPGPNYVGYGRFLDENLVYLLENFAGNSAPSGQNLLGQVWYNKSSNQLNVFTPIGYLPVSGTVISDTQPVNVIKGNTWYNETTGQYYYYDGTSWNLIGPAYTKLQGPSGAIPAVVNDANVSGVTHSIVKIQYGGSLVAIFSSDSQFVPSPAIPGFATISPGLNINSTIGYITYNNSNVAAYLPSDPTITNIISAWQANALAQGNEINAANAAIVTANLRLKEYSDYQDSLITTAWQANAAQQTNQLTAANAAIVTANLAVVSYVNTLNTAMRANINAANAAIVTANSAVVSYVNDQVSIVNTNWQDNAAQQTNQLTAANAAIVTANSAVVSYVNTLNTAMIANAAQQTNQLTAANAAIVTANSAVVSYVNDQVSTVNTNWQANAAQQTNQLTAANAAIVTANSAVVSYVNDQDAAITVAWQANAAQQTNQLTAANAAIVTANSAVVSYVNDQVSTVNTNWQANAAQQTNQLTAANAAIVTANTALKNYADAQISTVNTNWQANAAQQTNQLTAANAAIVTANSAVVSYVNTLNTAMIANVVAANLAATNANISLRDYTDDQIVAANTALKNYTDSSITTANTSLKNYADDRDTVITTAWQANAAQQTNQLTAANAAIVTANTALKSYTDNQVTTANTALKNYVDDKDDTITTAWQANAGAQAVSINSINANIGLYHNTTNANIGTITLGVNSINANLGAYQIWSNANAATQATSINTVNTNWQANAAQQANQITAANAAIVTNAYSNAKVAAYLPTYTGNVRAGNVVFADGSYQSTAYTGSVGSWTLVETISNFSVLGSASIGFSNSVNYYSSLYNDFAIKLYWTSQNATTFVTMPIIGISAGQRIILGQRNSDGFHDLEPDQYSALSWASLSSSTGTFYFGGSTTITGLYLYIYAR